MSWEDRIKPAAYTSPSGQRLEFDFENLSFQLPKKTSAHEFPDAPVTLVQDRGPSGRRLPMRIYLTGADHDILADQFIGMLAEAGPGRLEDPLYGTLDVVPFGTISRRDDLKTAANQSVIDTTFYETTLAVYPTGQTDARGSVVTALDNLNAALITSAETNIPVSTALEEAQYQSAMQALITKAKAYLEPIANASESTASLFKEISDSIVASANLIPPPPPDQLIAQFIRLMEAPARAEESIERRLSAYQALAAELFPAPPVEVWRLKFWPNTYQPTDTTVMLTVSNSVRASVNTEFTTRSQAVETAAAIIEQFEQAVEWRDEKSVEAGVVDTGETYQALQSVVALAAGYLIDASFSLQQEHTFRLDRDRTIVDLCAELYGDVDGKLDFFISSNDFSGDQILELKEGSTVVYYA